MKIMKTLFVCCLLTILVFCKKEVNMKDNLPLLFVEEFEGNMENWQPNFPQNWQVINDNNDMVYYLFEPGKQGIVRAPTSRSILESFDVTDFELIVRAKCLTDTLNTKRDICLFWGYQDSLHYYYAHFSGTSDNVHNIIAIVNNADRTKINQELSGTSKAILTGEKWYTLKIIRKVETGLVQAYIEDMEIPVLTAVDKTFKHGKIGIGTFDDPAEFTRVELYGKLYNDKK